VGRLPLRRGGRATLIPVLFFFMVFLLLLLVLKVKKERIERG